MVSKEKFKELYEKVEYLNLNRGVRKKLKQKIDRLYSNLEELAKDVNSPRIDVKLDSTTIQNNTNIKISQIIYEAGGTEAYRGVPKYFNVDQAKKDTGFVTSVGSAVKTVSNTVKNAIATITETARPALVAAAFTSILGYGIYLMTNQGEGLLKNNFGIAAINPSGKVPEAIVGGTPLYSVQMIERARSDRKLKSRAIGDVFLAHQKGNKDVLRIDTTLTGALRFAYLWTLISLQKISRGNPRNMLEQGTSLSLNKSMDLPAIRDKSKGKSNLLNYEVHRTFPILTQSMIITNMYLQTIEWHQSVEDGIDVIKCHLLFRKWIPPETFRVFQAKFEKDSNKVIGASSFGLELGAKGINKLRFEFLIDAIWKMMRTFGEIYGHLLIKSDGSSQYKVDQQAWSDVNKLIPSYQGKLFGIWEL